MVLYTLTPLVFAVSAPNPLPSQRSLELPAPSSTVALGGLYPGPRRCGGARAPEGLGRELALGWGLSSSQRGRCVWLLSPHSPIKEGHAAGGGRDKGTFNAGSNCTQLEGGEEAGGLRGVVLPSTFPIQGSNFKGTLRVNDEIHAIGYSLSFKWNGFLGKPPGTSSMERSKSFQVVQKPEHLSSLLSPRLARLLSGSHRPSSRAGHPAKRCIWPPPPTAAEAVSLLGASVRRAALGLGEHGLLRATCSSGRLGPHWLVYRPGKKRRLWVRAASVHCSQAV